MRYVTSRVGAGGKRLYYWQRKGFPLTRLPDNPIERHKRQEELNAEADRQKGLKQPSSDGEGSVKWCIEKYRASQRWRTMSEATRRAYGKPLAIIESVFGETVLPELSRRSVVDLIESQDGLSLQRKIAAVGNVLWGTGTYYGFVRAESNPFANIGISRGEARVQIWTKDDCEKFLATAKRLNVPAYVTNLFQICRYTAQRPSDVMNLTHRNLRGDTIILRQGKVKRVNGEILAIPIHPELAKVVWEIPSVNLIAKEDGEVPCYQTISEYLLQVREEAGLDRLQIRDLRRTACVEMMIAGVSLERISAISGHSLHDLTVLQTVYLPADKRKSAAQTAMESWVSAQTSGYIDAAVDEMRKDGVL